jgi:hypothetical protein
MRSCYKTVSIKGKKGILKASDDVLIPRILKTVVKDYMKQYPRDAKCWVKHVRTLDEYWAREYLKLPRRLHANFVTRIGNIEKKVIDYLVKEEFKTRKAIPMLVRINDILIEEGIIEVREDVQDIYNKVTEQVMKDLGLYNEKGEWVRMRGC